jgi:hypothetical protein
MFLQGKSYVYKGLSMINRLFKLKSMLMMLVLLTAITASSNSAQAWNRAGHERIAGIAWGRLTPEAQKMVHKLLISGVDSPGTPCDETSFINLPTPKNVFIGSASWLDCARTTPPEEAHVMHADRTQLCPGVNLPSACKSRHCASDALNSALEKFRDPQNSIRTRRIALKMIIHLMGDLHQPLHAAQAADPIHNGGTMKIITSPAAESITMHQFWDSLPSRMVSARASEYRISTPLLPEEDAPQWHFGTVDKWLSETVSQTVEHVNYPPLKVAMCNPSLMQKPILITPAYMKQAKAFADYKVAQAGVRLARIINRVALGGAMVSIGMPPQTKPRN